LSSRARIVAIALPQEFAGQPAFKHSIEVCPGQRNTPIKMTIGSGLLNHEYQRKHSSEDEDSADVAAVGSRLRRRENEEGGYGGRVDHIIPNALK
jgi:hypothetical protein